MNFPAVEELARAILYEGYLLYPYRHSALKNRQRWMFGRLLPREYCLAHGDSEPCSLQTECLIAGSSRSGLEVRLRFLQLVHGDGRDASASNSVERTVAVASDLERLTQRPSHTRFAFSPQLAGTLTLAAESLRPGLYQLRAVIENVTPAGAGQGLDQALFHALLSTHLLLGVEPGEFVSLIDPPATYRDAAAACRNIGGWPVLVGPEPGKMMLSAPIILYDYPQVAAESPGDLFDGTEIDELLSLRIRTLTDDEKRHMRAAGGAAREVLERTESLTDDQLLQLHGRLEAAARSPADFQPGDRVRLRPRPGADALDLLLGGRTATVASVQHDFEDRVHLGVVLDDDPGRDFGLEGLPGHRFFFGPDEVERL